MAISGIAFGASAGFSALRKATTEKMFQEADTNHDGSISKAEFSAARDKHCPQIAKDAATTQGPSEDDAFKAADTDGSGSVSKDEFSAMLAEMETKHAHAGRPSGAGKPPGAGGPPPAAGGKGQTGSSSAIKQESSSQGTDPADSNGDGKVSAAEQLAYDLKHPKDDSEAS